MASMLGAGSWAIGADMQIASSATLATYMQFAINFAIGADM